MSGKVQVYISTVASNLGVSFSFVPHFFFFLQEPRGGSSAMQVRVGHACKAFLNLMLSNLIRVFSNVNSSNT